MESVGKKIKNCKKCALFKIRKNPTIGEGNLKARILFIGEAPGKNEDETGKPFCGRAGKVLDELLEGIRLERKNIFITNIVKCRPPKNRDPTDKEISACVSFLEMQIEEIKPKIICPLGRFSSKFVLEKYLGKGDYQISKIHGTIFKTKDFKIIPMYHPAFAIYNSKKINILKKDFKKIINK